MVSRILHHLNFKMIEIEISISTSKWFDTLKEVAEFLDIKNASKSRITKRCEDYGYTVNFNK